MISPRQRGGNFRCFGSVTIADGVFSAIQRRALTLSSLDKVNCVPCTTADY